MSGNFRVNTATILTLIRLVISPLVVPVLLVLTLPYNNLYGNALMGSLFLFFGLTDFFDGYFARKFNQVTKLGKILDPIADKFLTYSTLIALLVVHKIFFFWVIVLIGREFFVMGIRLVGLEHGISVPSSHWGKAKTFIQMLYLGVTIVNPDQATPLWHSYWNQAETMLLLITLISSVWSAWRYYQQFMRQYEDIHTT